MKVGVFGGSFNPVHQGHLRLARELILKDYIKRLVFVPVGDNYKKSELILVKHRLKMLEIATKNDQYIDVSTVEAVTDEQNLTIKTLDQLQADYLADMHFIMGSDLLSEFNDWEGKEGILERHKILILNRAGFNDEAYLLKNFPKDLDRFVLAKDLNPLSHASTKIRKLVKAREDYHHYLDPNVSDYIEQNNLYK